MHEDHESLSGVIKLSFARSTLGFYTFVLAPDKHGTTISCEKSNKDLYYPTLWLLYSIVNVFP